MMTDDDREKQKRRNRECVRAHVDRMRDLGIVRLNVMVPVAYLPAIKAQAAKYRAEVLGK